MVDDLEPERQYQFWVTVVTNAGEGMRSDIIVQTPSKRGKKNINLCQGKKFKSSAQFERII